MSEYERDTTPFLKKIAEEDGGQSFDHCISHGQWTGTSTASMLTGTYPPTHKVYGGGNDLMSEDITTVPELLSSAGYRSFGMSPNAKPVAHGIDRGFDKYKWIHRSNILNLDLRSLLKYMANFWRHGALTTNFRRHKRDFVMNDMAKRFVSQQSTTDQPFFLFLHYASSHCPYLPANMYLNEFIDDISVDAATALNIVRSRYDNIHKLMAEGCELTSEEWEAVEAMYDAEIKYVDYCAGQLIKTIRDRTADNTIFVITGDHGDLLGEHGLVGHKFLLNDALVHVPMITYGLENIGHQADEVVQHIDFVKTMLSQVGITNQQFEGIDLSQETRQYAVSQRGARNARVTLETIREYNPGYDLSVINEEMLTAFRSTEFKYLHSKNKRELFELPDETTAVEEKYPDVVNRFEDFAGEFLDAHNTEQPAPQRQGELDPAMRDHLSDMGYVQ
jgi:uncharacterized sulfatase